MDTIALLSVLCPVAGVPSSAAFPPEPAEVLERLARPVRLTDRGRRSAAHALSAIASQVQFPAVFDPSAGDGLRKRVAMEAWYLNGYEAFACLARLMGMEVVVLPSAVVIASPARMPGGWRALAASQHRFWHARRRNSGDGWASRLARRADVRFVEVTLGAALRHVTRAYRTDVFASAELWQAQELISIEAREVSLETVLTRLAETLGAFASCRDGAVWLEPVAAESSAAPEGPALRVVVENPPPAPGLRRPAAAPFERIVRVPVAWRTRGAMWAAIAGHGGVLIRDGGHLKGGSPERVVTGACGRLGDVLEAARMIWRRRWQVLEHPAEEGGMCAPSSPAGE